MLLVLLCLEISFELMTGQHMILILLEMNVLVVLMSSILQFKGCYRFMLVSILTFFKMGFNAGWFYHPCPTRCFVSKKQLSNILAAAVLQVLFLPKLWRETTYRE